MTMILLLSELQPTVIQLLLKYCMYYASTAFLHRESTDFLSDYCLNFNLQVGHTILHRENYIDLGDGAPPLLPLHCQMPVLEALMTCVQMGWMAILVCYLDMKYVTVTWEAS